MKRVLVYGVATGGTLMLLLGFAALARADSGLRFNEIMYDPPRVDPTREWVELFNASDTPITLVGGSESGSWRFIDNAGPHLLAQEALIGSTTIPAWGYAILAANAEVFIQDHPHVVNIQGIVIDAVMHLENSQNHIGLLDGNGNVVTETYWASNLGATGNGKTLEFSNGIWRESLRDGGTPGEENSIENLPLPQAPSPIPEPNANAFLASTKEAALLQGSPPTSTTSLVINEFYPSPPRMQEWIELKNEGKETIDLSRWVVGVRSSNLEYPLSGILRSGGYLVIPSSKSKLSLRTAGDTLYLKNPDGYMAFEVRYDGNIPSGWTAARLGTGWKLTRRPASGSENMPQVGAAPQQPSFEESVLTKVAKADVLPDTSSSNLAENARKRAFWILAFGLGVGAVASFLALFFKRRLFL